VKQSHEKPEIYDLLKTNFGVNWNKGVIITYGDTIYCKWKVKEPKLTHEKVHIKQQKEMGVDEWWDKYLSDEQFRLQQELEAYKAEIEWIKENVKGFVLKDKMISKIIMDISSDMYGGIISFNKAKNKLKIGKNG
jgi:hypothetical protein